MVSGFKGVEDCAVASLRNGKVSNPQKKKARTTAKGERVFFTVEPLEENDCNRVGCERKSLHQPDFPLAFIRSLNRERVGTFAGSVQYLSGRPAP